MHYIEGCYGYACTTASVSSLKFKFHDHMACLEHRLPLWHDSSILDLLTANQEVTQILKTLLGP